VNAQTLDRVWPRANWSGLFIGVGFLVARRISGTAAFSARRLVVFGLSPNVGDRAALARTEMPK
jgi:hypothetical protein